MDIETARTSATSALLHRMAVDAIEETVAVSRDRESRDGGRAAKQQSSARQRGGLYAIAHLGKVIR